MKISTSYSLLRHNTFSIQATCKQFVEIESVDDALAFAKDCPDTFLLIGGGSNLLLTQDYPGTVVHVGIKGISQHGETLYCGAGEVMDGVIAHAISLGLYGAENLSLIPGEVGASAVQNIGAYGMEVKDLITQIEAVDLQTGTLVQISPEDCQYGYRKSRFKGEWKNRFLITHVTYRFSRTFQPVLNYGNIRARLSEMNVTEENLTADLMRKVIISIREEKLPDPAVEGNAGSFFMNPVVSKEKYRELEALYPGIPHYSLPDGTEKIPAGWMIEQCGFKGKTVGRAGVHSKQALVLVNRGGAEGREILHLCKLVQEAVSRKFGIQIHPEVNVY